MHKLSILTYARLLFTISRLRLLPLGINTHDQKHLCVTETPVNRGNFPVVARSEEMRSCLDQIKLFWPILSLRHTLTNYEQASVTAIILLTVSKWTEQEKSQMITTWWVCDELNKIWSSTAVTLQQLLHHQDVDHLIAHLQTTILWTEIINMFIRSEQQNALEYLANILSIAQQENLKG